MDYVTTLGLVAAVLSTSAFLPQALKTIRSRQTEGISLLTYSILTVGVTLWLVYGLIEGDLPVALANGVTLCLTSTILSLKVRHG